MPSSPSYLSNGSTICLLLCLVGICFSQSGKPQGDSSQVVAPGTKAEPSKEFTEEQEGERKKVLESDAWLAAKALFDEWLSVQKSYSPEQVKSLDAEFGRRISEMNAGELKIFLGQMSQKLAILLDPSTMDARRWVEHFAAPVQEKIIKKFGVEDPMRLSAAEMDEALRSFDAERRARGKRSQADARARTAQVKAINKDIDRRAKSRAAARNRAGNVGGSYSPRKGREYNAGFQQRGGYSVGPWGGVRIYR